MKLPHLPTIIFLVLIANLTAISCKRDPDLRPRNQGLRLTKVTIDRSGFMMNGPPDISVYEYSPEGRLLSSSDNSGQRRLYFYTLDRISRIAQTTRQQDTLTLYTFEYDVQGRIKRCLWYKNAVELIAEFSYQYNSADEVIEELADYKSFQHKINYAWKEGSLVSETFFTNGKPNGGNQYRIEEEHNPYRLLPSGIGPFSAILASKKMLSHVKSNASRRVRIDKSGYPSSIYQRNGSLFGNDLTTSFEYQKF